jgi:hypothetical protein
LVQAERQFVAHDGFWGMRRVALELAEKTHTLK